MQKKQCPFCGELILETETVCPYCYEYLKLTCPNCGRIVSENERICPDCSSQLPVPDIEKPYGWFVTACVFISVSGLTSLLSICEKLQKNTRMIESVGDFLCIMGFFLVGLFFGLCAISKKQNIPAVIIMQLVSTILLLLFFLVELLGA